MGLTPLYSSVVKTCIEGWFSHGGLWLFLPRGKSTLSLESSALTDAFTFTILPAFPEILSNHDTQRICTKSSDGGGMKRVREFSEHCIWLGMAAATSSPRADTLSTAHSPFTEYQTYRTTFPTARYYFRHFYARKSGTLKWKRSPLPHISPSVSRYFTK